VVLGGVHWTLHPGLKRGKAAGWCGLVSAALLLLAFSLVARGA
jgi:hypothetical protein